MDNNPQTQPQMQASYQPHELRPELSNLLNYEYHTNHYTSSHTFLELLQICEAGLRDNIHALKYEITYADVYRYGMKLDRCEFDPFQQEERTFLGDLVDICEKVVVDPQYKHIDVINRYVIDGKLCGLKLTSYYRRFELNFNYVNIKEVLVFSALSQCNVWYTICKNRKKSKKQFDLDPLIEYFNNFVTRLKLQNPYHIDILPKKQVKSIERRINQEKIANPLFEAVSNGDHELVKELLQKGAKIQNSSFLNNRQRTQVKCVHKACLNGDLKMCKLLDSFGANWESEDSEKMTPLFYAIQSSNLPIIKYLVEELKVNIEKEQIQSRTPFYWACTQGDIKVIDYFYKRGCNINHKSELGRTALSKSCYLGRRDIVMYLLDCKEIDMYSQCKKGRTALHNAVFGPKGGREGHKFGTNEKDSPECAQIMLEKGMNVDILDFEDCTPLHVAMSSEAMDSIRLLVAYGASLTAKNNYGETPLMTGAKFGHVEACRFLYEQCHADILCVDIFEKNLLLLTAKFQQNSEDGTLNPAYTYFLEPLILQCQKRNRIDELHRTFTEIVKSQFSEKMIVEIVELWKGFKKYGVAMPQLAIGEIENILSVSIKLVNKMAKANQHGNMEENGDNEPNQQSMYIKFALDILSSINLPADKLKEVHMWLLKCNQPKILQFVHENQLLCLDKMEISASQFFYLIENDEIGLKEKVVSFCLLSLNFDWIKYRTMENTNILHVLVRKQRSGCIVQLFKALSGKIPHKILTNRFINREATQENKKILQTLLWQKDESGLDAHQLSLVLKNKSVAKLIEQKLKEQNLEFSSVLDVKQYAAVLEIDPKELEIFNNGHEREEQLAQFEERVAKMSVEELMDWWAFRKFVEADLKMLKEEDLQHQCHQKFWKQIESRPLHFIRTPQQLQLLTKLSTEPVLGIDIEYFTHESITLISIFQLSSLTEDFIIDCLNIDLQKIKQAIQPLLYNEAIVKIMHGADNDLVLVKSLFNLSLVNFGDTSRLDIQLREIGNDLRGLATLAKEYLGATMSKEYQVSEWRIRPIPKAMLQYAKKDSMILPFLLADMLDRIKSDPERIRQFILGGCKQARRNKKVSQPLVKSLRML